MDISKQYEVTTQNRLTITAHKKEVRIKFAIGNSPKENQEIEQLCVNIINAFPDLGKTMRGRWDTEIMLKLPAFTLRSDSNKLCVEIVL
jgi:hypothetical protein